MTYIKYEFSTQNIDLNTITVSNIKYNIPCRDTLFVEKAVAPSNHATSTTDTVCWLIFNREHYLNRHKHVAKISTFVFIALQKHTN